MIHNSNATKIQIPSRIKITNNFNRILLLVGSILIAIGIGFTGLSQIDKSLSSLFLSGGLFDLAIGVFIFTFGIRIKKLEKNG